MGELVKSGLELLQPEVQLTKVLRSPTRRWTLRIQENAFLAVQVRQSVTACCYTSF